MVCGTLARCTRGRKKSCVDMKKDENFRAQKQYRFSTVFNYFTTPLAIEHATGGYLSDADVNQCLDLSRGIGTSVCNATKRQTRRCSRSSEDEFIGAVTRELVKTCA